MGWTNLAQHIGGYGHVFKFLSFTFQTLGYGNLVKNEFKKRVWVMGYLIIKENSIKNKLKPKISFWKINFSSKGVWVMSVWCGYYWKLLESVSNF